MRLSVVIAGENAPESAFVVWRGYQRSIEKAAELGYEGVELALGGADDVDRAALEKILVYTGLTVSCISTGLTYAQRGLYMTHPDASVRKKTIETFRGLIDLASDWGGLINVGRARGFIGEGQTHKQAQNLFLNSMCELLPYAVQKNVTILIEPVNRYEINFVNTLDDAAELLRMLESENAGIMADLFHMNIEDDSIYNSLRRNANYIKYIHAADSNRKAPGRGHIDFPGIIQTLRDIKYDGWLGAEILPGDDPDAMAAQAARYLCKLI